MSQDVRGEGGPGALSHQLQHHCSDEHSRLRCTALAAARQWGQTCGNITGWNLFALLIASNTQWQLMGCP